MLNFFEMEPDDTIERASGSTLWAEKYRPRSLDTLIGNDHLKAKLQGYIESQDIPHLLLHGKPGTGKTTVAKILYGSIDSDYIYVNASDENSVDVVRTKIKDFARGAALRNLKIVVLDEFDYMTLSAQAALRNMMEQFQATTRFILTCNHFEKVHDAIISRTQVYNVVPPSKQQVAVHVANILTKENVTYDLKGVALVVDKHFPDIRKTLNTLQRNVRDGKLQIDSDAIIDSDYRLKLLQILSGSGSKNDKFKTIRQLIADMKIHDFSDVYTFLYSKVDDYAPKNVSGAILALAEGQYKDSFVADKEICFAATMLNLLDA